MTEISANVTHPSAQSARRPLSLSDAKMLLFGLGLATAVEFYTFDGVNLVLPDMAGSFGISRDQASWILTTYSSTMFFGVPLSIWLAAHLRHRRYIIGSVVLFAIASVGSSLSSTFETLLFWRAIEGFAGSGLTMWWRASIYMLVDRQHRSASLMRVSVMLYLATTVGLLYAGFITDHVSWRLIFLPNVLFAIAAIVVLRRHYPDVPPSSDSRVVNVDKLGITLIGIAVIALQVMLSRGEIDGWFESPAIHWLAWIAVVALLLFICWETSEHNRHPLLRLHLIRTRPVLSATFLGIFAGTILSGSLYALPEYLRGVDPNRLSASDAGRLMCVYALTAAAIRPFVVTGIAKFGQRKTIAFAFTMLVLSMLVFARLITSGTPEIYYAVPLVMYAFCLAPMLSSIGSGTVGKVEAESQLDAVSIYMTFRQLGTSLGVTVVSIVLHQRETLHSSRLYEHLHATHGPLVAWVDRVAGQIIGRGGTSPIDAKAMAVKILSEVGATQASTLAYADVFYFMAAIGVAALCVVPLMPPSPVAKK
ncbi:MFS transporter [Dyella monticola]|uniref:MFS transporter n=1 Tax=Dyella monticola TaxID=1927958 RepID=A0A370WXV1_9GAMM|nr:MFS transporter [Dyella monticola]RDS80861.1 MFS transporter [Dyella monticola]